MRSHLSYLFAILVPVTLGLACTGLDETALPSSDPTAAKGGMNSYATSGAGGMMTAGSMMGAGGMMGPGGMMAAGGIPSTGGFIYTGGFIPYGGTMGYGGYWNTGGITNTGGIPLTGYVAGMVTKPGGTRDLVSMQCLGAGPNCTHTISYASCMVTSCPAQTGTAIPVTVLLQYKSLCGPFYSCIAVCPCDQGRAACENACLSDAKKSPDCYAALAAMDACALATGCDKLGCPMIK